MCLERAAVLGSKDGLKTTHTNKNPTHQDERVSERKSSHRKGLLVDKAGTMQAKKQSNAGCKSEYKLSSCNSTVIDITN